MYLGEFGFKFTFTNVSTKSGTLSVSCDVYGEFAIPGDGLKVLTRRTSTVNEPYPLGSAISSDNLISLIPTLTSKFTAVP